jgi:hypothetical protein
MDELSANNVSSMSTSIANSSSSNDISEDVLLHLEMPRSFSEPLDLQKSPNSVTTVTDKDLQETDGKRVPETGSLRDLLKARNELLANRPAVRNASPGTTIEPINSSTSDQHSNNYNPDSKSDESTVPKSGSEDVTKSADSSVVMRHSRQSIPTSIFASDPNRQSILPSRRKQFRFIQPQKSVQESSDSSFTAATKPDPPAAAQLSNYLDWVTLCETLLNEWPPERNSTAQQERGEVFSKAVESIETALKQNPRIALLSESFSGVC